VYTSQLGVTELTGANDGVEVESYLKLCGFKKGAPWCAAFVSWCHVNAGIKAPVSAWSPAWFTDHVIYKRDWRKLTPEIIPGMVFGIYYSKLQRVGHVGLIDSEKGQNYYTIEGNTNVAGSREGDGVYKKIRSKKLIYVISDYTNN
jgi:hypothetical protein